MPPVTLSFEVHQPHRLRVDGVKKDADALYDRYFDDEMNEHFFKDVAENCYFPATERLLRAAKELEGTENELKVNFSISTSWIEQAKEYHPELIDMLNSFPDSSIDFIGQAYFHSLAGLFEDKEEFRWQLNHHREIIEDTFGVTPQVMTNTELIYHNEIGKIAGEEGYKGIFTEGADRILGWRSANHTYKVPEFVAEDSPAIMLRNRKLTDDVGYRFSAEWWSEFPLTAEKYAAWIDETEGDMINLFMDYETFGEHHWEGTGILWFLEALPHEFAERDIKFAKVRDVVEENEPVGEFDAFEYNTVSWADQEMDASAWLGNPMQKMLFEKMQDLESKVKKLDDPEIKDVWRKFLTSDHLHHIATKTYEDGNVHNYFSYFDHPHEGFAVITEHLMDFQQQVEKKLASK
ncbi:glycoside hydrolase family 57 protein [Candidatus Nanohalococcus occultus]|uniref:Alpha-amylase, glycosyl hydrolase family 57 n=1 Tax=Candidatus Nanohalococcus occultus TaxID=2978047 RepID=A0ABY8CGL0_9ARCH|nr:Alpha-amylase, glycosyl hydrolase family 57 [Candidatus Nanohaloarchaeota archaeon SVXNc]